MNDERCGAVQDKLPLVVHGTATWTPAEAAHLARCAACDAERALVERAARLGGEAAARIDSAALAAGVLREVNRRRRSDRWIRRAGLVGLAAAAALVVMVGVPGRGVAPTTGLTEVATLTLPLAELDSLDAYQLEAVLEGFDAPVGEMTPGPAPSFDDLNDAQLERVLRSLEG